MQISLEWLKDYIKIDADIKEVTKLLTFSGIEVENVVDYGAIPDSIITAKVVSAELVKDSDHLMICKVDTGSETYQVVCGAPNCSSGIVGVLALPGTEIGETVIKKTKIRGVESSGMLCSEKELGLSDDHSGIITLPADTPLGKPVRELFRLPDTLLELEITPNRPDLLGYLGVATDLAALVDRNIEIPVTDNISELEKKDLPVSDSLALLNYEPELCPRYTARVIKDVRICESPIWLKLRLIKSGLRPINNIVDITNYTMLETGHPLHAFDYDKLEKENGKPVIKVRRANAEEIFPALDGKTYCLDRDDLVIADANRPVALAGVIGGMNSHITENTINIVLEAACFNHSGIRRTSYKHKISTDSSYRFERQMAAETAEFSSRRATQLILELAGGTLCEGTLDDWQNKQEKSLVPFRPHRFKQVIGINLSKDEIISYLSRLGLTYLGEGSKEKYYPESRDAIPKVVQDDEQSLYFKVNSGDREKMDSIEPIQEALYFEVPPKRVDLTREIDLIEEVIRLHGMNKVAQEAAPPLIMDRHSFSIRRKVSDILINNGFQEIVNLSFTDPELIKKLNLPDTDNRLKQIELLNPQNSNLSVLRTAIIPQLLLTARYNLNHDMPDLKLFELNKIFLENSALPKQEEYRLSLLWSGLNHNEHWKFKAVAADFFAIKGLVDGLLSQTGLSDFTYEKKTSEYLLENESQSIMLENKVVAEYGKLKPEVSAKFDIDTLELKQDVWIADIDINLLILLSRSIRPAYRPVPRFPSVQRDLSFLIQAGITQLSIMDCIRQSGKESILSISLLDKYTGKQVPEGFRSLTYRMVFNNPEKTLTDDEVDALFETIVRNLKNNWNIQLR